MHFLSTVRIVYNIALRFSFKAICFILEIFYAGRRRAWLHRMCRVWIGVSVPSESRFLVLTRSSWRLTAPCYTAILQLSSEAFRRDSLSHNKLGKFLLVNKKMWSFVLQPSSHCWIRMDVFLCIHADRFSCVAQWKFERYNDPSTGNLNGKHKGLVQFCRLIVFIFCVIECSGCGWTWAE